VSASGSPYLALIISGAQNQNFIARQHCGHGAFIDQIAAAHEGARSFSGRVAFYPMSGNI